MEVEIWVGFGVDPITQGIYAIGCGDSEEVCKEHQAEFEKNGDGEGLEATYFKILKLDKEFGQKLFDWLVKCGVPSSEATNAVRGYGKEMTELL